MGDFSKIDKPLIPTKDKLTGIIISYAMIFIGEVGDKTFMACILFMQKISASSVIIIATFTQVLMHLVSCMMGLGFLRLVDVYYIKVMIAFVLVMIGMWNLCFSGCRGCKGHKCNLFDKLEIEKDVAVIHRKEKHGTEFDRIEMRKEKVLLEA